VRPVGRVTAFEVAATELAVSAHRGPLHDIDLAYAEIGAYTMRHEISVEGPVGEYYLRDSFDTPDAAEWLTEICWPIFRADTGA
jgi:effector-binding domain-containing protein